MWIAERIILALIILGGAGRPMVVPPPGMEAAASGGATLYLPLVVRTVPQNGERSVIGYSVAGRPLEVYRFGYGPRKRLILGGIHGGYEWNTTDLVQQLMDHTLAHPEIIPADQTLYFLPTLNPDGLARSLWTQGRANDHNVDINRNFDYNWKPDWYRIGCWNYLPITAGTRAFSEPEARALRDFVQGNQIESLISYHSVGAEIYAGGKPADPDSLDLALTLKRASGYAYPPHKSTCEETGQMIDWASTVGIAAVDVEMGAFQSVDYDPNERILDAFLGWSRP